MLKIVCIAQMMSGYYTSVISFLLNVFITLLHRVLYDKCCYLVITKVLCYLGIMLSLRLLLSSYHRGIMLSRYYVIYLQFWYLVNVCDIELAAFTL